MLADFMIIIYRYYDYQPFTSHLLTTLMLRRVILNSSPKRN